METDQEAALKEEHRLLRSMNNRVNNALNNKPKANFSFNSNNSTTADPPSSKAAVTRTHTGTFGSYNAINPFIAKLPATDIKSPAKPASKVTQEPPEQESKTQAQEIVKSSNSDSADDLKKIFADDHVRSIKMEEERLSRALGRRSDKKQAPRGSFTPVSISGIKVAQATLVHPIKEDNQITPSPNTSPHGVEEPRICDLEVVAVTGDVEVPISHQIENIAAADGDSNDILAKLSELDSIIEDTVSKIQLDLFPSPGIDHKEAHDHQKPQPVEVQAHQPVQESQHTHEENQQPHKEESQHVYQEGQHAYQEESSQVSLESEHDTNQSGGIDTNEMLSNGASASKTNAPMNSNELGSVAKFQAMVVSAAKSLKADQPFNGDDTLTILEAMGKVIMEIIPTIENKRLAGGVYQAAKDLIRGSISLKQAWENWDDCEEPIAQVLSSLGVLYINVVAAC